LSKRHGATCGEEFFRQGYRPKLWLTISRSWAGRPQRGTGDQLEEITQLFDLTRIQKNPAIFDTAKLNWMNRNYITKTPGDALVDKAKGFFAEAGLVPRRLDAATHAWLAQMIDLVKTHVDHLDQLPGHTEIIYAFEASQLEPAVRDLLRKPEGQAVAREFLRLADEKESLTPETYREIVGQVKDATHQKGRNLFHPIRAALTGRDSGPEMEKLIPLYEVGSRLDLPARMSSRERRTPFWQPPTYVDVRGITPVFADTAFHYVCTARINPVAEALRASLKIERICERSEKPVFRANRVSPAHHVGSSREIRWTGKQKGNGTRAFSVTPQKWQRSLPRILEQAKSPGLLVLLDGIEDPHNLGLFCPAEAAGADGVSFPASQRWPGATVVKTSAGAAAHVKLARVPNLAQLLELIKKGDLVAGLAAGPSANLENRLHDAHGVGPRKRGRTTGS
jgi:hypothetical protein